MRAPGRLWELYRADDLPGFIKEWRRLNPGQSGAVQAWVDIALKDGAYADVEEEEDP
ncbi:unnamed protein product [marine sediment metagenome]|uniref:Uncharacterized protein n=1 Tax=marine sediment metagenome TaxID=412755 RepID=X1PQ81_9ZZZZ